MLFALQSITVVSAWLLMMFALHRGHLLWMLYQSPVGTTPAASGHELPLVGVQLPLFNEATVAARALRAIAALDWPKDRLHIQVCDDSTDDTKAIVDRAVCRLRDLGHHIDVLRRPARTGFKAGALAAATEHSTASYICIVDADFVLPADFLHRMLPSFSHAGVGVVQARWTHLNRRENWLTQIQAILLDAHFAVEHAARSIHGCWFNFNGTAGVWRRSCIDDAGGWQGDTLSEDVDLSYRAQLRGWQFVYRDDVEAPAELPATWTSFAQQQRRWMVGLWQVAAKLLPSLWRAALPKAVLVEATLHLLAPLASVTTVLFMVVGAACAWLGPTGHASLWLVWSAVSSLCVMAFFIAGQRQVGQSLWAALAWMPVVFVVGAALAASNVGGLLHATWSRPIFKRTQKRGGADVVQLVTKTSGSNRQQVAS
jgi:cellulose synthase/poly-beta-1,6-N-acetylglucosamine synthase-like glycosyltransferase